MKLVEKVKIKSGKLKDKEFRMVLTPSGYVPRDPSYPLSGEGKEVVTNCEKVAKVREVIETQDLTRQVKEAKK